MNNYQIIKEKRESLILDIATKVCEKYQFEHLPNIEAIEGVKPIKWGVLLCVEVRVALRYDKVMWTPDKLLRFWLLSKWKPEQIEEHILQIDKLHKQWVIHLSKWNEIEKLEQILESI